MSREWELIQCRKKMDFCFDLHHDLSWRKPQHFRYVQLLAPCLLTAVNKLNSMDIFFCNGITWLAAKVGIYWHVNVSLANFYCWQQGLVICCPPVVLDSAILHIPDLESCLIHFFMYLHCKLLFPFAILKCWCSNPHILKWRRLGNTDLQCS